MANLRYDPDSIIRALDYQVSQGLLAGCRYERPRFYITYHGYMNKCGPIKMTAREAYLVACGVGSAITEERRRIAKGVSDG